MGAIKDLTTFLQDLTNKNIQVVCCDNFKPLEQRGQTCKLAAGSIVQRYLFEAKLNSQEPLPMHKDKHGSQYAHSLRERAKEVAGSAVGEVYGPEQLQKIFNDRGYSAHCYRIDDEKIYEQFIKDLVSQKQPVIMFFDVAFNMGELQQQGIPKLNNGMFEHGAPIIGYYYDADQQMQLIYSQWGEFFTASLHDAFLSTQQLSKDKHPEKFYKHSIPLFKSEAVWNNKVQTNQAIKIVYDGNPAMQFFAKTYVGFWRSLSNEKRTSNPPNGLEGSLAGVLCVLQGDKQELTVLDTYKCYTCVSQNQTKLSNKAI